MSVKLIDKVFNTNVKGNEKLTLLALADNSNDTGVCFPSYNTLQRKTSMNRGTLAKWIKSLEDKGLILKANRKRKNGANSSNKYLLFPSEMFDLLDEEDAIFFSQSLEVELSTQSLENKLAGSLEIELGDSLEVKLEGEPSLLKPSPYSLTVTTKMELFDMFWKAYPRKSSKQKAKEAFMKPKNFNAMPAIEEVISKIDLLKVTDQWRKDGERFIPHPASWLNAHGWEDEVKLTDNERRAYIQDNSDMSASDIRDKMIGVSHD